MDSTADYEASQSTETDVNVSYDVTELSAASADQTFAAPVEIFGSWAQYEKVQYQSTTVVQSTALTVDQPSAQHYTYPAQESQVLDAQTAVSASEAVQHAMVPTAADTYQVIAQADTSQTMAYGISTVLAVTDQDSTTSVATQAYVQTQQVPETTYMVPSSMPPQGVPSQASYTTEPVINYQTASSVPATQTAWQPAFVPVQAQYSVQAGVQANAPYQQVLHVAPDGQYYTQGPVSQPPQGQQAVLYQVGPNGVPYTVVQSATGLIMVQTQPQTSLSVRKYLNKEKAVQASQATINATKRAYGKSKEFIVNKDGARAVAKTTWKQGKEVLVKTNDVMDKYVKPLMPFIAATDPELAATLMATSQVGGLVKGQDRQQMQVQQARIGQPGAPQLDTAALANLAPIVALLQQASLVNAATGNQQGNDAQQQAGLLAALLQVQQQHEQQPQIQQSCVQQQQHQFQYQAQQPYAQQQRQASQPQLQQHPVQQPQMHQAGLPSVQQPQHPYVQTQEQRPQPVQQPHFQQQPQQIPQGQPQNAPRRKPVSSVGPPQAQSPSSQYQPTTPMAAPDFATASQPTTDHLASLLQSQLTLEQPIPKDQPQVSDANSWTHHALHSFGIVDILLPSNAEITPASTSPYSVLVGKLSLEANSHFEIELFHNSSLLQRRINDLQSLPVSTSPSNAADNHVLESLAVRSELNPAALVAADCLVGLSEQRTSYKVLLQSRAPQGFGISIASFAGASGTASAKALVMRIAGSVQWAAGLGEDVSSLITGTWRSGTPVAETREFVFDAVTGRYTYQLTKRGTPGDEASAHTAAHASGTYQVFSQEGGCQHLVMTDDNPSAEVDVRAIEMRGSLAMALDGIEYRKVYV